MLKKNEPVQVPFIEMDRAALCINCDTVFRSERVAVACPRCGSTTYVPLSRWLDSLDADYNRESYDAMLQNLQKNLPSSQAAA